MASAAIAAASNGNNEIVAAVTGCRIRVFTFALSFSGSVNAKWRSASTDKTGLIYGAVNVNIAAPALPFNLGMGSKEPLFETVAGEALNLNLSGATAVGGYVVYDLYKE